MTRRWKTEAEAVREHVRVGLLVGRFGGHRGDPSSSIGPTPRSRLSCWVGETIHPLLHLAGAWHSRVMADELVSRAFSHGFHPHHSERLAAYWAEALGGPTAYSDTCGDETSVVRIRPA